MYLYLCWLVNILLHHPKVGTANLRKFCQFTAIFLGLNFQKLFAPIVNPIGRGYWQIFNNGMYYSISSSDATAWRTQSSHEHSTCPVPMPFRSLHLVAPHCCSNSALNWLDCGFMRLPTVNFSRPWAICAPQSAPQVSSMLPMPLPKHAPIAISRSSGRPSSGAKAISTAWQQFIVRLYITATSRRGIFWWSIFLSMMIAKYKGGWLAPRLQ